MREMGKGGGKTVKVDYRGSLFSTYFDDESMAYYCPICGAGEDRPMFFSVEDLIAHIRTHVKRRMGVPRHAQQPRPEQAA